MNLDPSEDARNRRLIAQEMFSLGINLASLTGSADFLAEYTVPVFADRSPISELVLGAESGAPLCRYGPDGRVFLSLARLTRIVRREHRYLRFIMTSLYRTSPAAKLIVNWGSFDAYLLRRATLAEMSDIHWLLLHFAYHAARLAGRTIEARRDFATMQLEGPPVFYARHGVVELRALRTVIEHDSRLHEMTREIAARQGEDDFMHAPWTSNDAEAADPLWTIRMLMTNAGMYGGSGATLEASLRDWAGRYLDAMRHSHSIFLWWDVSLHSHIVQLLAEQRGLLFDRLAPREFPATEAFYAQLAGRRTLFVTAYAPAVDHMLSSGNIARIWKTIQPPPLYVRTVQAFVSTHPNAPHGSWSETYAALAARVDAAIVEHDIDLVIGACGCYGIPLLHHCRQRHGVAAVYFGNKLNMWFGVKQNAFADAYEAADLQYWADPYMGWTTPRPTNIERIDRGRYIDDQG